MICAGLAIAACSPPFTNAVIDLRLNENGTVERTHGTFEAGWTDPFEYSIDFSLEPGEDRDDARQRARDQLDQVREACLDDGTCIRLERGATIVESRDDFDTMRTVWSVGPNEGWLTLSHGTDGVRTVAGVYDILVLPDQTVQVAAGGLGVLVRSTDGEWTPSEADLRTLSKRLLLAVLGSGALVILLGSAVIARLPGPHVLGSASMALVLVLPSLGAVSMLVVAGQSGWGHLALSVVAALLLPLALVLGAVAINRERVFSGRAFFVTFVQSLTAVWFAYAILAGLLYLLWSRNVLGWTVLVLGVHVLGLVGAAVVARQLGGTVGHRSDAQIQETVLRNPLPLALAGAAFMLIGVPALLIAIGSVAGVL
jgi:hypothetical protein